MLFSHCGTKNPRWSTLKLITEQGFRNHAVIRFALTASLTELSWKTPSSRDVMRHAAERHYILGLSLIEEMLKPDAEPDHLMVMISFWFWYLRHWRDSRADRLAYKALIGRISDYFLWHNLTRLLLSSDGETSASVTTCISRLTAWLFWADVTACFWGNGGKLARLLASSPGIDLPGLYARSKASKACYWGPQYPAAQDADDNENQDALDLIHRTWVLVQAVNDAFDAGVGACDHLDEATIADLGRRVGELTRGKYSDVIAAAESCADQRTRYLANCDWAVANLSALCIYLLRCTVRPGGEPTTSQPEVDRIARSPARLVEILDRSLDGRGDGQIDRLQWALFWVGVETRDRVHQKWVLKKITSPAVMDVLKTVMSEQKSINGRIGIKKLRHLCRQL